MDWRMPVMDGLEATRQITGFCLDVQVLMVSAYATSGFEIEAKEVGASGLIPKGAHPSIIVEAIEQAWHERRSKRDADTSRPRAMP
jgi:DNA-binding NarL/FixJ family response regulator